MTNAQTYTVFTPEIWSPKITEFWRAKLMFAKFFDNYSADLTAGGDILNIPYTASAFTAQSIKVTSGDLTATDLSDTSTKLTIDQWYGNAFYVTGIQKAQIHKQYKIMNNYMRDLVYALAVSYDEAILANASSITTAVGDSAGVLVATSIEKGMGILESNSVPINECAFFFHPKPYWNEVMRNSQYYTKSTFGTKAVLETGEHDRLYGLPVYISELIDVGTAGTEGDDGHRNLLAHPEAIVHAVQQAKGPWGAGGSPVEIAELPAEAWRTTVAGNILYGDVIHRAAGGIRILSYG